MGKNVLIELKPEIGEHIRRLIKISDGFLSSKFMVDFVYFNLNVIVRTLFASKLVLEHRKQFLVRWVKEGDILTGQNFCWALEMEKNNKQKYNRG